MSGRLSWLRARQTNWLKKLLLLSMIRVGNGKRQVERYSGSPQKSQTALKRKLRRRRMMKNLILIKVRCLVVMSSEEAKNSVTAWIPTLFSASYLHAVSWAEISSAYPPGETYRSWIGAVQSWSMRSGRSYATSYFLTSTFLLSVPS